MKKKFLYLLGFLMLLSVVNIFGVHAVMQQVDFNASGTYQEAHFVVQVLKYEPFPVNAGDWFDLWVKVQNIGQADAQNAQFKLLTDYPFESNDSLVRNYGLVPGAATAFRNKQSGDKDVQANEVIMKFRVRVADNAPEGESVIKLETTADTSSGFDILYDLPIDIGKTKTDFDAVMQDSTAQGLSFAISNIGENDATAITVSLKPQAGTNTTGTKSSIIGNLAKGDFTTVTFPIVATRNLHELNLDISYTDTAGVRNTVEKTVPVSASASFGQQNSKTKTGSSGFGYFILGAVLGIFGLLIYEKKIKKKK